MEHFGVGVAEKLKPEKLKASLRLLEEVHHALDVRDVAMVAWTESNFLT